MKITALGLLAAFVVSLASAQDYRSEAARLEAAEKLFELSAYTKLASRQIFETVDSLAPDQRAAARKALRDPTVIKAMRQVITRAMAGTYGVKELEFLHKIFSAPEMDTFIQREGLFRNQLQREFAAALLTNPALIGRIPPPTE